MIDLMYLVNASQSGDVEAYGQLARRFQNMAYGYACSILGDVQLAEDATQEAFIEAYDRLSSLENAYAFPAWLRCIVYKHCDRQTRGKRLKAVVHAYPEPISLEWEPSQTAERNELAERTVRVVQTLPEHLRELTTLFYLKGCSQRSRNRPWRNTLILTALATPSISMNTNFFAPMQSAAFGRG